MRALFLFAVVYCGHYFASGRTIDEVIVNAAADASTVDGGHATHDMAPTIGQSEDTAIIDAVPEMPTEEEARQLTDLSESSESEEDTQEQAEEIDGEVDPLHQDFNDELPGELKYDVTDDLMAIEESLEQAESDEEDESDVEEDENVDDDDDDDIPQPATSQPDGSPCRDSYPHCFWVRKDHDFCDTNRYISMYCRKSCGLCGVEYTGCEDNIKACAELKSEGFCAGIFQEFMKTKCKRTCGFC